MFARFTVPASLLLIFGGGLWVYSSTGEKDPQGTRPPANAEDDGPSEGSESDANSDPDAETRRQLVGIWTQNYYGRRRVHVFEDGTAKMFLEPDGFYRFTFGKLLEIDMDWSVEGETLTFVSLGGTPKARVEAALKMFGREKIKVIDELTEDAMILVDPEDNEREPVLTKVSDDPTVH